MNPVELANQKADLRKLYYQRRLQVTDEEARAAATLVAERTAHSIDVRSGTKVSAYWPLTGELDPRPALLLMMKRGARAALPRTVGPGSALSFHAWHPEDRLIEGRFKVMEPAASAEFVTPSVLLVPLLAFDRRCRRLGYGKGHYDRTLQDLRQAESQTLAVGIAFDLQEAECVPTDGYDQTLDMIITETKVHRPA